MANKKYYVQNTYTADLQIVLKKDDGRFNRNIVFPRYQMDRATGQVISDGYTELEEQDMAELNANGAFKLLVEKKKLIIKDEAPLKAGNFEQLMDLKAEVKALREENAALRARLAKYEGTSDEGTSDDGLDKLKLDELKAKAKELGLDAENLKKKDDVIKLIREASEKAGE